jgi:hypothetical protein
MSIANLNGGSISPGNVLTNNIDTPNALGALTIGTVNAGTITLGAIGRDVIVQSRLDTSIIDANVAVNTTLFIGPNMAVNIAIGNPLGNPVTMVSNIFTSDISRGGSLGAGILTIGSFVATSEVDIGQSAAPIKLLGSSVQMPSSLANPLVISNSASSQILIAPYTGAVVNASGGNFAIYRLGDWVTIDFRHLVTAAATGAAGTINMVGIIPVNYRPVNPRQFQALGVSGVVADNYDIQVNIFANGNITLGPYDTNSFPFPGFASVYDFSYTYNINN